MSDFRILLDILNTKQSFYRTHSRVKEGDSEDVVLARMIKPLGSHVETGFARGRKMPFRCIMFVEKKARMRFAGREKERLRARRQCFCQIKGLSLESYTTRDIVVLMTGNCCTKGGLETVVFESTMLVLFLCHTNRGVCQWCFWRGRR